MSCLFSSDDQYTGASASTSVLLVNIQGWSPLWLTGLISLLSKGLSGVFSSTTVESISYLAFYLRKIITLTIQTFFGRVMFLIFNTQPSLAWSKNASIYSVSGPTSCPEGHMKLFLLSSEMSGPWRSQTETISCYFGSLVNADTPSQNWGRVKEWGKGSFFIDLPLHAASCHYHVPNTTLSKLDQNSVFSSYTF